MEDNSFGRHIFTKRAVATTVIHIALVIGFGTMVSIARVQYLAMFGASPQQQQGKGGR